jgi:hypothetical protein
MVMTPAWTLALMVWYWFKLKVREPLARGLPPFPAPKAVSVTFQSFQMPWPGKRPKE